VTVISDYRGAPQAPGWLNIQSKVSFYLPSR
jgi:hypothetical protein